MTERVDGRTREDRKRLLCRAHCSRCRDDTKPKSVAGDQQSVENTDLAGVGSDGLLEGVPIAFNTERSCLLSYPMCCQLWIVAGGS